MSTITIDPAELEVVRQTTAELVGALAKTVDQSECIEGAAWTRGVELTACRAAGTGL